MFESLLVPPDESGLTNIRSVRPPPRSLGRTPRASNTQYQYQGLDLDEYDRKYKVQEEEYLEEVARHVSGPLLGRPATVLDGPVRAHVPDRFPPLGGSS